MRSRNELILVGDRVLISLDKEQTRTEFGLYLPPGVKEKEKVRGGYVVRVGPGYPLPDPTSINDEPWFSKSKTDIKYLPLQAQAGDYALFLSNSAIEIEFEGKKYVVVPHSAILVLVRDKLADMDLDL
jgi:co-chaperonin GroES (HSP10)